MSDDFLTRYELGVLRDELAKIDLDLEMEAAIMLSEPGHTTDQAPRRPQPGSRPPYNLNLQHILDKLGQVLDATITDMHTYRGLDYPGGGTLTARAKWVSRYRYALAMFEQGPDHHEKLCLWCDRLDRAVRHPEPEYVIDPAKHQQALASVVTGDYFERMAYKLGDQAKGITARRIKYLRERGLLTGTQDPETKTWFYRVGDILGAQRQSKGA